MNTLITSPTQRQKILDRLDARLLQHQDFGIKGFFFQGEYRFTRAMVATYYQAQESVIDRLLDGFEDELKRYGYILLEGKQLEELEVHFGPFIDIDTPTSQLGLFNIRSLIKVGMLLTDNEKARRVRNKILDLFISAINHRTGGGSRYVNPCQIDPLPYTHSQDEKPLDFDQIINLSQNKEVLRRLKQADDDNDE